MGPVDGAHEGTADRKTIHVDVAIVGAGPAGSAAATLLARAGRSVLLIDKSTFPRDKCCGDGLTAGALRRLESLGLDPGDVPSWEWVDDLMLVGPKGRPITFPLPRSQGHFSAVASRVDLDMALVNLAISAGAIPRFGVPVTAAVQHRSCVVLTVGNTLISAKHVLAADGMWSPLRKFLSGSTDASPVPQTNASTIPPERTPYLGEWHAMRQYYGNVHTEASRKLWIWFEPDIIPGYVWCFPLANGRVNVGFGIERTAQVKTKTMKALWASLAERPHIRAVLGPDAVAEEDVKAWPIPADIAHATLSDGRVLFIGDAARACDVLTGEGIGQAIQTGSYAAAAILAHSLALNSSTATLGPEVLASDRSAQIDGAHLGDDDTTVAAISAQYEKAVRSHLGPDHRMASTLQKMMRSEAVCRGSLAISGSTSWTRSNFARWLFEDYARGIALTPSRWKRGLMNGPGAYLNK